MTTFLLAYDGSDDAKAAIEHASQLLPGARTTVLCIWEPLMDAMLRSGSFGFGTGYVTDTTDVDEAARASCASCAAEGAKLAVASGLDASSQAVASDGGVARTILGVAFELDAGAIVLGTRGRGGMTSFLLGSVSHHVLQHADRPVLVVPSPRLSEERRSWVAANKSVAQI